MASQAVLQEIEKLNIKEKKVLSYLKKCLKKLSFKSSADLWNLSCLAGWLYVYGYDDLALQVCQIIDELEFKGNFDLWTPIEALLLLETRIYREQGQGDRVELVTAKILDPMRPHEEAFKRRLSFDWLSDKSIARYLKDNDTKTANQIRFSDLDKLMFIRELGNGKTDIDGKAVDIAKAEERIVDYKQILK